MISTEASTYQEFIDSKALVDIPSGLNVESVNEKLFDFQRDITKWSLKRGRSCIFADCGLGKGQPYGARILTPLGWRRNDELVVGDKVIASDGKSYNVQGIYHKPEQHIYRFVFSDKSEFIVDSDHLHIVRTNNDRQRNRPWRVMSTADMLALSNLRYGKNGKSRNYDIPVVSPVQFLDKCDSVVSSYILGVLLGDGYLKGNVMISSADIEIIDRVSSELPSDVRITKKINRKYDYFFKTGLTGNKRHPFREELNRLGVLGKTSKDKFIPESFMRRHDRIELLRGLMDTDGYIDASGCSQFYSISEKLADGVVDLVRSLGGIPTKSKKKTKCNGVRKSDCFIITFSLATMNPFYLPRKANKWNKSPRDNGRWIDSIKYAGREKTICISVDSPDSSYVTEHYIVTHNTPMQLSWADKVRSNEGDVLIAAPLAVSTQTVKEGKKFGIELEYSRDGQKSKTGITITNYEMLHCFNPADYSGIVLDESSILKSYTGKFRNEIINDFGRIPYRLACTATPAPNDLMELGNHAEFVGAMSRAEMLSMFFVHDGGETQKWRLKGHAQEDFWKWVCSWAVMIRKPSDLGYDDSDFTLSPLNMHEIVVDVDHTQAKDTLFQMEAKTLQERQRARKNSTEDRCRKAAEIANSSDEPWLIWCDRNDESKLLSKLINDSKEIKGSDSHTYKENTMMGFSDGSVKRLVTKPSIAGFGMNWQHCCKIIFVGLSDSYEMFYQAVRRSWRFGQMNAVDCYIIISSLEGAVLANIKRKEKQAQDMADGMVANMHVYNEGNIKGTQKSRTEYQAEKQIIIPKWMRSVACL